MNPEINKIVDEDKKIITKDGFFSNQSMIENTLNNNSTNFQRQKPKRFWEVKSKKSKGDDQTNEPVSKKQNKKAQIFNEDIQKVAKEEGVSLSKA